ncbi:MAG: cell wall hydrolase [Schwartzia sp.]|nr:cell wall hydrolase [Schwartzia sp. (in: firmicutes)]
MAFIILLSALTVTAFVMPRKPSKQKESVYQPFGIHETVELPILEKPEPREPTNPWSNDEVQAIAQTLAGECFDEMEQDKRLVCEVILNRVSDERFEDTIIGVLTTPNAFAGYWNQSRPISENDLEIAEQALRDWFANNCRPLSDIRFFCSGGGQQNNFY